ncbi:MAG TPA: lysine 5,6-aminomutase subunit alpha, partial [Thermoanaerobaculia bacterium]
MPDKLSLPATRIDRCRRFARQVAEGVARETEPFTTVSTERTVLRLLGVDGADSEGVPLPNRIVENLRSAGTLGQGAAVALGSALASADGAVETAARRLASSADPPTGAAHPRWREALAPLVESALDRIAANRAERERRIAAHPPDELPLLYAIVATGNIYEDVVQAEAA